MALCVERVNKGMTKWITEDFNNRSWKHRQVIKDICFRAHHGSEKTKILNKRVQRVSIKIVRLTGILLLYPLMKPLVVPQNTYSEGYRFLKSCL